jgi:hypothetical protein
MPLCRVQDKKVTEKGVRLDFPLFLIAELCTWVHNMTMPDHYATLKQQRAALLDQMEALDRMERGRLSEQFLHGLKEGRKVTWGPYYVLQRRLGGQIVKKRVPADRLAVVQADIRRHEEFQQLVERYAQITEEMTHLEDVRPELKKKPSPCKPISSRRRRRF